MFKAMPKGKRGHTGAGSDNSGPQEAAELSVGGPTASPGKNTKDCSCTDFENQVSANNQPSATSTRNPSPKGSYSTLMTMDDTKLTVSYSDYPVNKEKVPPPLLQVLPARL